MNLMNALCNALYYGLEACPLSSADFKTLEYVGGGG